MAAGNITITAVKALAEGWLWDAGHRSAVVGFGARRQTDGAKGGVFYYLRYRLGGRQRMLRIGRHGSPWTPDTARTKAKELLGHVAAGKDPRSADRDGLTFGAETERWLGLRADSVRPKTLIELRRHLRVYAKPLHPLTLAEINRRAIAEQLARIEADSGAVTRNRVRSSLSEFFTWAIAEGLLADGAANPVTATAKADEGSSRKRVLTDAELRAVWLALGDDRYGDIVRLLMLTAQRREEIGGLLWSEIEAVGVDGATLLPNGGAIRFPPERVKNKREHLLPLSPIARAIIEARRAGAKGDYVFGGHFGEWSRAKAALDASIADTGFVMSPFVIHDIRRSAATRMADRLGVLPHVIEAILNHVSGHKSGVAGVYNLALYEREMRTALCAWADYVIGLTGS